MQVLGEPPLIFSAVFREMQSSSKVGELKTNFFFRIKNLFIQSKRKRISPPSAPSITTNTLQHRLGRQQCKYISRRFFHFGLLPFLAKRFSFQSKDNTQTEGFWIHLMETIVLVRIHLVFGIILRLGRCLSNNFYSKYIKKLKVPTQVHRYIISLKNFNTHGRFMMFLKCIILMNLHSMSIFCNINLQI